MNKVINGMNVPIKNFELFKTVYKDMLKPYNNSNTVDSLPTEVKIIEKINKCLIAYRAIMTNLPFPLNALDVDTKYVLLGMLIKKKIDIALKMWVDKGLHIKLDDKTELYINNKGWCLLNLTNEKEDTTLLENYKDELGYTEYNWAFEKYENKASLGTYYSTFMPEFVKACKADKDTILREVKQLTSLEYIPMPIQLKNNCITDVNQPLYYYLDVYAKGTRKKKEKEDIMIIKNGSIGFKPVETYDTVYDFNVYCKEALSDNTNNNVLSQMKKVDLDGFASLFGIIVAKGENKASEIEKIEYKGIKIKDYLVFEIYNQIYVCKANVYEEPKLLDGFFEIYNYKNNILYLISKNILEDGLKEEKVYTYNLETKELKLVNIKFVPNNSL